MPSRLCVWSVPAWRNASKIASWSAGAMPMPESLTEICATPFSRAALKVSVAMPVLVTVTVCGAESVPIRCVSKVS